MAKAPTNSKNPKSAEAEQAPVVVSAFKGFDKNLSCRGHQFEVGRTYTIDGPIKMCARGWHSCENPFDVWNYYGPFESRFAEVDVSGDIKRHDEDSKIASASITIKAELNLPQFIQRAVDLIIDVTRGNSDDDSGDYAQIGASGDYAQIGASGNYAQIGASGNYAQIGVSGNYAKIGASGDDAKIGASGNYAKIGATGKNSVIASAGVATRAKGRDGTWISLAEFNDDGKCIGFAIGCVGNDGVPADVWLVAKDGNLIPEGK